MSYSLLLLSYFNIDTTVDFQSDAADTIFFIVHFSAATNQGWLLFESSIYFAGKLADSK